MQLTPEVRVKLIDALLYAYHAAEYDIRYRENIPTNIIQYVRALNGLQALRFPIDILRPQVWSY